MGGTSAGVYIFNPDSLMNDPDNYITYNYNNGKLRSNEIKCIHQDSKAGYGRYFRKRLQYVYARR